MGRWVRVPESGIGILTPHINLSGCGSVSARAGVWSWWHGNHQVKYACSCSRVDTHRSQGIASAEGRWVRAWRGRGGARRTGVRKSTDLNQYSSCFEVKKLSHHRIIREFVVGEPHPSPESLIAHSLKSRNQFYLKTKFCFQITKPNPLTIFRFLKTSDNLWPRAQ